jgi:TRAP-type C4-dicarboxylate transport system permease large subunit
MVVVSVDLLLQLPTVVVLHPMVVALAAAAMATHLEVVVASLGGNFPPHGASLFLFDSTSVHLRRDKGV